MSEFKEIMQQADRLCKSTDNCVGCPLEVSDEVCYFDIISDAYIEKNYDDFETRVRNWVKEHPAPLYPTWGEWFHNTFPKGNIGCFSPCAFYDDCDSCKHDGGCNDLYFDKPIPADIAEKLGIKPRETRPDRQQEYDADHGFQYVNYCSVCGTCMDEDEENEA